MSTCKITITEPKDVYTCNDRIAGTFFAQLPHDTDVYEIWAALTVVVFTRAVVTMDFDRTKSHTLYERKLKLFPPPELENSAKHFTLKKGTICYPFEFRLPRHGFGPSFENFYSCLEYCVQGQIESPTVPVTARYIVPFRGCIAAKLLANKTLIKASESLEFTKSSFLNFRKAEAVPPIVTVEVKVPQHGLVIQQPMGLRVYITGNKAYQTSSTILRTASISLVRECAIRIKSEVLRGGISIKSLKLDHRLSPHDQPQDVSSLFSKICLTESSLVDRVVPSFETQDIKVSYTLVVDLELEVNGISKVVKNYLRVPILSNIVHDHTKVVPPSYVEPPMYSDRPEFQGMTKEKS